MCGGSSFNMAPFSAIQVFSMPKIRQLPIIGNHILPDDVDGVIVSHDLEITVIRSDPLVLNLFDRHHQGIELDTAGRFIDLVAGIALDTNFHIFSPQTNADIN